MRQSFYRGILTVFAFGMFYLSASLFVPGSASSEPFWQNGLMMMGLTVFLSSAVLVLGLWRLRSWAIAFLVILTTLIGATRSSFAVPWMILLAVTLIRWNSSRRENLVTAPEIPKA